MSENDEKKTKFQGLFRSFFIKLNGKKKKLKEILDF